MLGDTVSCRPGGSRQRLRGARAYLVQVLVLNSFGNLFLFLVCFLKEKKNAVNLGVGVLR